MSAYLPVIVSMFYRFVYNLSFFLWALFLLDRGFTPLQMGFILGVNSLVSLLASVPSGFANDRFSSKHLLQLGVLLFLAQLVIILFSLDYFVVIFAFALSGLGHRLLDISIDSFVLRVTKKLADSKILSWFLVLRFLGIAAGILLGTYLLGEYSFEWVIYASMAGLLLLSAIGWFLPNEVKVELAFKDIWTDLKSGPIAFFMIGIMIFALHFGAETVAYVPFLEEVLGLEGWHLGAYMALGISLMGFAGAGFSKLVERGLPSGYLLIGGLLVSGLFHMGMVVDDLWLSLTARVIHEIGDAAVFTFLYQGFVTMFPDRSLSSNFGLLTFLTVLATGMSAWAYGYVVTILGIAAPLFISGAISVVLAFLMLFGLRIFPKIRRQLFVKP